MSKTKKSKLLASMLCAAVMAGLYAGPVMADNNIANSSGTSNITVDENGGIIINVLNQHVGDYSIKDNHALFNFYGTISANSLTGDELVVEGSSGAFIVKDIPTGQGGSTMVFTEDSNGKDTMYLDTATGNLSTAGTVSIGANLEQGTAKVIIDGETGSIKVGNELFAVDGTNGNAKLEGELIVNNGLVAGTDGNGTFKVKNIDGNTMAYMVDKDGNYTVGINAQNGNIETKGALAVTNADGANVFTANSNGISVGGGLFAVDALTGNTNIAGGLSVGTDIEVKGAISASSLTLGTMNVGNAITELQNNMGTIDGDVSALNSRVTTVEGKTDGISNVNGITTVKKGLAVVGQTGSDGNPLKVFEVGQNGEISAFVPDWDNNAIANFAMNSENVELKYGNNGMFADINGTIISGNGNEINLNEDGATFTNNNNGTSTVINGGAITADTLNLTNLDEDVATEINNLKDTMGTVGGDVADLRTDVADLRTDVGVLRTDVGDLRTDVGTLKVDVESLNKRLEVVEDKTQNINGDNTYGPGEQPSGSGDVHEGGNTDFTGNINSDSVTTGEITADKGTIGGVTMEDGSLTADKATIGDVTVGGSLNVADKVTADKDGVTVKGDGENNVKIDGNDVSVSWKDDEGNSHETSIRDNYEAINDLDNRVTGEVNRLDSRIDKVEDRIDKVGAMAAAIANLRTMGYDPAAPTEIAVGIGQYRSETGAALGLFHYPNRDFMLSLSVSTSGDEVMGGIGATWKFGRKTPEQMLAAEKEKAAKAKLAKAEAMKKAAAEAKVAAQQAKHAKMAAEKAAK